ncbi:DUF1559 domain-containing protein [bacterium]|nr:DUF1559 domain-containing protein [bacterium]
MNDVNESAASGQPLTPKSHWPAFRVGLVLTEGIFAFVVAYAIVGQIVSARARDEQSTGLRNVRNIGLAALNYSGGNDFLLPPAVLRDDQGKPQHSWRVALLGLMDGASYGDFDLSQPADSPLNKPLLATPSPLSEMFQVPGSPAHKTLNSSFFVITGNETPFPQNGQVSQDDISKNDGLTTTLMIVEAANMDITWTEPKDIPFDALNASPKDLRGKGPSTHRSEGAPLAIFCDGHGTMLNPKTDPTVLKAISTWKGKEPVTLEDF